MGIGPSFAIPEVVKSAGLKLGDDNLFEINEDYEDPFDVFEENGGNSRAPPLVRVENMFEDVQSKLPEAAKFLLCLLPERRNCDLYGPWKKCLADIGIVTQCITLVRVNDQYLTNVLLKINAKLGGLNSMLAVEHTPSIPLVSKVPTMIVGMDVSHGSPGHCDVPSIAAAGLDFLCISPPLLLKTFICKTYYRSWMILLFSVGCQVKVLASDFSI